MPEESTIHCIIAALGQGLGSPETLSDHGFSISVHQDLGDALKEALGKTSNTVLLLDLPADPDFSPPEELSGSTGSLPPVLALSPPECGPDRAGSFLDWAEYVLPVLPGNSHLGLLPTLIRKLADRAGTLDSLACDAKDAESLRQDIKNREEELSLLTGMSQLFHSCADEQALIEIADMYFPLIFSYAQGAVYLIEEDEEHLVQVYSWGEGIRSRKRFRRFACQGVDLNMPHSVRSLTDEDLVCGHIDASDGEHIAAFCLPLVSDNYLLGLMYLQAEAPSEEGLDPTRRHESLSEKTIIARTVAESIALALSNIRLRRQLREMAIRDQLTGLFNRRYLEETLEREASSAIRNGYTFALIMFDIDHFKRFNDTYGHEAGDLVLSELGAFLLANSRSEDVPCRYGGEEIMLIMVNTTYDNALRRAEDIRARVSELSLSFQNLPLPQVTLSCGVAAFPHHGENVEDVVDLADKALYRAKENGRNQVCGQDTC